MIWGIILLKIFKTFPVSGLPGVPDARHYYAETRRKMNDRHHWTPKNYCYLGIRRTEAWLIKHTGTLERATTDDQAIQALDTTLNLQFGCVMGLRYNITPVL